MRFLGFSVYKKKIFWSFRVYYLNLQALFLSRAIQVLFVKGRAPNVKSAIRNAYLLQDVLCCRAVFENEHVCAAYLVSVQSVILIKTFGIAIIVVVTYYFAVLLCANINVANRFIIMCSGFSVPPFYFELQVIACSTWNMQPLYSIYCFTWNNFAVNSKRRLTPHFLKFVSRETNSGLKLRCPRKPFPRAPEGGILPKIAVNVGFECKNKTFLPQKGVFLLKISEIWGGEKYLSSDFLRRQGKRKPYCREIIFKKALTISRLNLFFVLNYWG